MAVKTKKITSCPTCGCGGTPEICYYPLFNFEVTIISGNRTGETITVWAENVYYGTVPPQPDFTPIIGTLGYLVSNGSYTDCIINAYNMWICFDTEAARTAFLSSQTEYLEV